MSGNWNSPPKPTKYEKMRKPRKTTGNLMSDRIFDFKYSNFPCWRMCAVSRGVHGCSFYMVRSTLLLFSGLPFRGRVIWPSGGVQHFSMELSSWAWFLSSILNCSYLYIPNLRFSNSSKNKHISNIIFHLFSDSDSNYAARKVNDIEVKKSFKSVVEDITRWSSLSNISNQELSDLK